MADSSPFEQVSDALEQLTTMNRLEARGTVRLALKVAGLSARSVRSPQFRVVIERVLSVELIARGIDDAERVCDEIANALLSHTDVDDRGADASPEAVFRRLQGR